MREEFGISAKAKITSENHVPTAAGLASSASAFAALALAGSNAAGRKDTKEYISRLARFGSGSASRSVFGDFVIWEKVSSRMVVILLPFHSRINYVTKCPL